MAAASAPAVADLGRLSVRSGLDQTFRGTIVATGEEARILRSDPTALKLQSSVPGFAASVSKLKSGSVRISLFSTSAVRDPIVNVTVAVGGLSQSYTAMLDAPKLGAGNSGGTAAVTGRSGYNPSTVSQTPAAKRRAHSHGYRDPASSRVARKGQAAEPIVADPQKIAEINERLDALKEGIAQRQKEREEQLDSLMKGKSFPAKEARQAADHKQNVQAAREGIYRRVDERQQKLENSLSATPREPSTSGGGKASGSSAQKAEPARGAQAAQAAPAAQEAARKAAEAKAQAEAAARAEAQAKAQAEAKAKAKAEAEAKAQAEAAARAEARAKAQAEAAARAEAQAKAQAEAEARARAEAEAKARAEAEARAQAEAAAKAEAEAKAQAEAEARARAAAQAEAEAQAKAEAEQNAQAAGSEHSPDAETEAMRNQQQLDNIVGQIQNGEQPTPEAQGDAASGADAGLGEDEMGQDADLGGDGGLSPEEGPAAGAETTPAPAPAPKKSEPNYLLYGGIGAGALVLIALLAMILGKKKGGKEPKAPKEPRAPKKAKAPKEKKAKRGEKKAADDVALPPGAETAAVPGATPPGVAVPPPAPQPPAGVVGGPEVDMNAASAAAMQPEFDPSAFAAAPGADMPPPPPPPAFDAQAQAAFGAAGAEVPPPPPFDQSMAAPAFGGAPDMPPPPPPMGDQGMGAAPGVAAPVMPPPPPFDAGMGADAFAGGVPAAPDLPEGGVQIAPDLPDGGIPAAPAMPGNMGDMGSDPAQGQFFGGADFGGAPAPDAGSAGADMQFGAPADQGAGAGFDVGGFGAPEGEANAGAGGAADAGGFDFDFGGDAPAAQDPGLFGMGGGDAGAGSPDAGFDIDSGNFAQTQGSSADNMGFAVGSGSASADSDVPELTAEDINSAFEESAVSRRKKSVEDQLAEGKNQQLSAFDGQLDFSELGLDLDSFSADDAGSAASVAPMPAPAQEAEPAEEEPQFADPGFGDEVKEKSEGSDAPLDFDFNVDLKAAAEMARKREEEESFSAGGEDGVPDAGKKGDAIEGLVITGSETGVGFDHADEPKPEMDDSALSFDMSAPPLGVGPGEDVDMDGAAQAASAPDLPKDLDLSVGSAPAPDASSLPPETDFNIDSSVMQDASADAALTGGFSIGPSESADAGAEFDFGAAEAPAQPGSVGSEFDFGSFGDAAQPAAGADSAGEFSFDDFSTGPTLPEGVDSEVLAEPAAEVTPESLEAETASAMASAFDESDFTAGSQPAAAEEAAQPVSEEPPAPAPEAPAPAPSEPKEPKAAQKAMGPDGSIGTWREGAGVDLNIPLQTKLDLVDIYLESNLKEDAMETLYDLLDECDPNSQLYKEAMAKLETLGQPAA